MKKISDAKYLSIFVPADLYCGSLDEEDTLKRMPGMGSGGDTWNGTVDLSTGKLLNWKANQAWEVSFKVVDRGVYSLLDADRNLIVALEGYIPNKAIPGEWGDYIDMDVAADGTINNWPKSPDFGDFAVLLENNHE